MRDPPLEPSRRARAFRREVLSLFDFGSFESYGAEFLIKAKRAGLRVGCVPIRTVRRERPRLGGALSANLKILLAWPTA